MAWLPDHIWLAQKAARAAGRGFVKGKGKAAIKGKKVFPKFAQKLQTQAKLGKVFPKSAQKLPGQGKSGKVFSKFAQKLQTQAKSGKDQKILEKLKTIDSTLKVWVGGLKKNVTWKDLEKHFATVAKPSVTHINEKNGSGVVCFKSDDDVSTAIATLNGTSLKGSAIEVDAWVKPEREKKDKSQKVKKPKAKKPKMMVKKQGKAKAKPVVNKADEKIFEKLKEVDESQKVWVGGLGKGTNWQLLKKHFTQAGKPKLVAILSEKKGTAVVTFDDVSDVQTAIDTLNGSVLKGKEIEVDAWSKPEKKPKAVP